LLSLIVLNELDWWVCNQWENFKTSGGAKCKKNFYAYARKYTNLKDGFIVRYADDFKIMCKTYEEAQRYYHAVIDFLDKRLGLEISPEKSKVVNLKKNSSDFLGFKIKVVPKGKTRCGFIAKTDMNQKAIRKTKANLKKKIVEIQKHTTSPNVVNYNLTVIGAHNYYKYATNIYNNMSDANYSLLRTLKGRLKNSAKIIKFEDTPITFQKKVKGIRKDRRVYSIMETPMLPISGVHHCSPMNFSQSICNYTVKGREKIHINLKAMPIDGFNYFNSIRGPNDSIEFNDNKISRYLAQYGKCHVLGEVIEPQRIVCHRKVPIHLGGNDRYSNLVILDEQIRNIIIEKEESKIFKRLRTFDLGKKQLDNLNKLRILAGRESITYKIT
jgi:hypothetical protein